MFGCGAPSAGDGPAGEWLKSNGDPRKGTISVSQWVERIPFKETRNYTRSILADLGQTGVSPRAPSATSRSGPIDDLVFKPGAVPVASSTQDLTSTVSRAAELRSPAFAQNMRVARKEIET